MSFFSFEHFDDDILRCDFLCIYAGGCHSTSWICIYGFMFFTFYKFLSPSPLFCDLYFGAECSVAQTCLTLWEPMRCGLPGSCALGIFQGRILEWAAISCYRESFRPRDQLTSLAAPALAGGLFTPGSFAGTYIGSGGRARQVSSPCGIGGETGYTAREDLKSVNSYNRGEGRTVRVWFFHSCIPRPSLVLSVPSSWGHHMDHPWVSFCPLRQWSWPLVSLAIFDCISDNVCENL